MKVIKGLLFYIFLLSCILGRSQVSKNYKKNSYNQQGVSYIHIEKKLPVLQVDSCLLEILKTITDRDIHCSYFRRGQSCFYISSSNKNGYLLNIIPTYNDILYPADYFGVLEVNNLKFICYGDDEKKFFHKSNADSITIKYRMPEMKTLTDTLEYEKENLMLLCDGCFSEWSIICNNIKIKIYASICNKAIPNFPKNHIKRHKTIMSK